MARKSRKLPLPQVDDLPQPQYRVGLYARLSVDKGEESRDSIANQLQLMEEYITSRADMIITDRYIDLGQSGTNFQRGEFNRLISDVRKGQINCVVVKDLSRFGRNHIEAGSYIEEVFPFLGVRFISVNDHYDSKDTIKKGQGLLLPLQNIVNEMYARDISAKVKSQLRLKQARGEYMGAFAPYGYLRDPNQTSRLIPDPQTAPIVGKIFALRAQGVSCQTIAELLTEEGIPPPSRYRRLQSDKHVEGLGHSCWHKSTIKRILTNPTYLGDMVQCKEQTSVFWGHRRKQMPPDQWVRVRATHTPIITQQDFLTVQASFQPKEYQ